jgi:uncharacterized protein YutE (UPF0331/DUF86 family)
MSKIEKPYEAYVYAVREQVEQHLDGLDQLSESIQQHPLTFNERNALARGLQVLVEVAVGCSKHLLKSRNKPVPSEARAAMERVYEILALTLPPIDAMRGAIGMRNAIIHDYLNLDWQRVETVLKEKKYHDIGRYINSVSNQLLHSNSG